MHNRQTFLKRAVLLTAAVFFSVQVLAAQDEAAPQPQPDKQTVVSYADIVRPKRVSGRRIAIPDVGEYKVLKGDFHMHTIFSDGQVIPQQRVRDAAYNGFDALSITDHLNSGSSTIPELSKEIDRNRSYELAKEEAEKRKLLLVFATEIAGKGGHFNAHFITDRNPIATADEWIAKLAVAAEQGAFIHWNHPGDRAVNGKPLPFTAEHEAARARGHLHGVEVINGHWYFPFAHDWCSEKDLAPMANSDIHGNEHTDFGQPNLHRTMTLILAKERTLESLKEAFHAKRTIGWAANMILGRDPWVEKLFRACVKIEKTDDGLTLKNRSDIPCIIDADGKTAELPPLGTVNIGSTKKLTVTNWFIGANKPLIIVL
ncbi:MAG: hypothetical protein FWE67_01075 [Planctomycetaceae bacterium]|nr:hypothetical protein [Planctomycetaceae bacterium]